MAGKKKGSALGKSRFSVDIGAQQAQQEKAAVTKKSQQRQTLNCSRDLAERLADAAWFTRETKQGLLERYIREGLDRDAERLAEERGEPTFDFPKREVKGKRWK